jgi:hypothetical protein
MVYINVVCFLLLKQLYLCLIYVVSVGYVLYSLHVCVWARQIRQLCLTIPISFALCVACVGHFPRGG